MGRNLSMRINGETILLDCSTFEEKILRSRNGEVVYGDGGDYLTKSTRLWREKPFISKKKDFRRNKKNSYNRHIISHFRAKSEKAEMAKFLSRFYSVSSWISEMEQNFEEDNKELLALDRELSQEAYDDYMSDIMEMEEDYYFDRMIKTYFD